MPTPPTLTALQQNVLNYLTDHLRAGNTPPTLHYQEVGRGASPDFNPRDRHFRRISKALHKINQHEAYYKRPLPGAMVVRSSDDEPGRGFYPSALEAGHEFDSAHAVEFWHQELAALIAYWTAPERRLPEESQLDRIESKLDRIIKHLAA